jgi:pyruvate,water dikinase
MANHNKPLENLIYELKERAKELNCLYQVQELLSVPEITIEEICQRMVEILPPGWQYPDICQAKINFGGISYHAPGFQESPWEQSADILVQDEIVGTISVFYAEERPQSDEGPFLKEERKLINTVAEQFGFHILHSRLRQVFQQQLESEHERRSEWWVILDLLKRTDPGLLLRISRKMINFLGWSEVKEAEQLLEGFTPALMEERQGLNFNHPNEPQTANRLLELSDQVFSVASKYLSRDVILDNIQKWMREDRSGFLINALVNPGSSLAEINSAIERYRLLAAQKIELTVPREKWFKVAFIRRILDDDSQFIRIAKNYIELDDFSDFMHHVIFSQGSHGKLGGKSSGLFLAAQILKKSSQNLGLFRNVRTPKTWYLTSDTVFYFMSYNNLEDIVEQKYKEASQVRREYPFIVSVFKNARLPPEIVKSLSQALDEFGEVPLIVRSSSLLEDKTGAAFAGKYNSLFIANQGNKEARLAALIDAIAEVYASMYGPDPIEYRCEHDLIDDHEEMGILIQEVVGRRVGRYYLPAFAGVAFSQNEFRWSNRIRREDGLVRLVPGLGTRAVDRLSDDYPILFAPGQPGLRVNVTLDEIIRYAPHKIDLINLESRKFESVEIRTLLNECGSEYPLINQLVSVLKQDHVQQPSALGVDFERDELVVTFDGLIRGTDFVKQIYMILKVLQETLGHPVDVEFAHDGSDFYLLQCRSQSYSQDWVPATIPRDIPPERVLFTARRFVPNGKLRDISHIVYVDPQGYGELGSYHDLVAVGQAVGRLNQILPKRRFILMGPGRWGSRGDIKMGVSVLYSDINNTALLVEIAHKKNGYTPDPSFGTHFFQDLVEASIRYLPLYPDEPDVIFNEAFLIAQENKLASLLPDFTHLCKVLKVIDVAAASGGQLLQVYMNGDAEEAVAILAKPDKKCS